MCSSVYLASFEGFTGKSTVARGLLEGLSRRVKRVGVTYDEVHQDASAALDRIVAVGVAVARTKLPQSAVAGRATVFVFPDLNTGNNSGKAVQRSAGAVAVGPVLQGLHKPVNELSRGATVRNIVNTVAITAIQAQLAAP